MAVETERKFTLSDEVGETFYSNPAYTKYKIQQFYLSTGQGTEIRIRIKSNATDEACCLTLKSEASGAATRHEFEFAISKQDAVEMVHAFGGIGFVKHRTVAEVNGTTWEIDRFEFDGVIFYLAEVEFRSLVASEAFVPPDWVAKEVSGHKEYYNSYISKKHGQTGIVT